MNIFGNQAYGLSGQNTQLGSSQGQELMQNPNLQSANASLSQNSQALFTQEQIDSIISGRVSKLNQKIAELTNQLNQTKQMSQTYQSELTTYKNREIASNSGIPSEFIDFAIFEAGKLTSDGKSFEDAIKEVVSTKGQIFGVSQTDGNLGQSGSPASETIGIGANLNIQSGQVQQSQAQVDNVQTGGLNLQTQQVSNPGVNVINQPVQNSQISGGQPQINGGNIQYGSTNLGLAGNPNNSNDINLQVSEFLKSKGLKK